MLTTRIDPPLDDGRCKVWWLIDGHWVHKGWLMPAIAGE